MSATSANDFVLTTGSLFDIDRINQLENSIFDKADRFSRRRFQYLLSSKNAVFFLCGYKDDQVGYGIALRQKLKNGVVKGRIYSLGVVADWRNRGAASRLLTKLEDWLIHSGASFITLETRKSKSGAKGFFEKKGYRVSEFLPDYYSYADGVRMKKTISPRSRGQSHSIQPDSTTQKHSASIFGR